MSEKVIIQYDGKSPFGYSHLDPIVDLLLLHGNELACEHRWGANRTGYFCNLRYRIDFDLLEENFEFPDYIRLNKKSDSINCDKTWAEISGGNVFVRKPVR